VSKILMLPFVSLTLFKLGRRSPDSISLDTTFWQSSLTKSSSGSREKWKVFSLLNLVNEKHATISATRLELVFAWSSHGVFREILGEFEEFKMKLMSKNVIMRHLHVHHLGESVHGISSRFWNIFKKDKGSVLLKSVVIARLLCLPN
jgi:hypothetical protein